MSTEAKGPNRKEYDRHWRKWTSEPPPVDPREAHHNANTRHPAFMALCEKAAAIGWSVELVASELLHNADQEIGRYRKIERVLLRDDKGEIRARRLIAGGLDTVAVALRGLVRT